MLRRALLLSTMIVAGAFAFSDTSAEQGWVCDSACWRASESDMCVVSTMAHCTAVAFCGDPELKCCMSFECTDPN